MHIKRFTGPSVKEAMREIKAEFGDGALILSTKRANSGFYEVVAAVDYDLSRPVDLNLADGPLGGGGNGSASAKGGAGFSGAPGGLAGNVAVKGPAGEAKPAELSPAVKKELEELRDLKELCRTVLSNSKTEVSGIYVKLEEELTRNGVDSRLARKILMNTFKGASKEKAGDLDYLKAYTRDRIFEKINVVDPLVGNGIVAFVGSAGVGKTTTIAKLAAIHALKKKRRLALLTMDTYRIAAAEQLKVYGRIIGVPVEVAKSAGELASCIDAHRDKELILIDTAGRGQRAGAHMKDLKEISMISPSIRFNLVLSAQTRDEGLYDCVRGFGSIPVNSLTFTKLDECGVYGPILNTMILARKPVAYLTSGQRVPEDIEAATRERLINFFMPN